MEMEVLFDDRFVVMAGTATKWIRRRKLVLADLLNELWVLPPPESLPGQYIAQAFRNSGIEPPRAHVVSFSIPLHHHLLATGRYITMLPRSMLRFGKHMPLKLLPIESAATGCSPPLSVCFHSSLKNSPGRMTFGVPGTGVGVGACAQASGIIALKAITANSARCM